MNPTFTNYSEPEFEVITDECLSCNGDIIDKHYFLIIANDYESYKWRYDKFIDFLLDYISHDALSAKEREACINKPGSMLRKSLRNLRTVQKNQQDEIDEKGGEIGEILLYGIMKKYYNALPVVPKIFYKQNKNDYAKGADSVHIVIEDNDKFSLWLGESKFYKNIDDAINNAIQSVNNGLQDDKLKKEKSIITNISDLDELLKDNTNLLEQIKTKLNDNRSLDELKPFLHIPIFLLYECSLTKQNKEFNKEYQDKIIENTKKDTKEIYKRLKDELKNISYIDRIYFHIIFFPIPDKNKIIEDVNKSMEGFND